MQAVPKVLLLKKLIKKRKNMDNQVNRKEFNVVSQAAAEFSSNPANVLLSDHLEYGRAQSRGHIDSLMSKTGRTSNDNSINFHSPQKRNKFQCVTSITKLDTSSPQNQDHYKSNPSLNYNGSRSQVRTADWDGRRERLSGMPLKKRFNQKSAVRKSACLEPHGKQNLPAEFYTENTRRKMNEQFALQPYEDHDEEAKTIDQLSKSIMNPSEKQSRNIRIMFETDSDTEPYDQFSLNMQDELGQFKSDLSKQTNIANLIQSLTSKYLNRPTDKKINVYTGEPMPADDQLKSQLE